MIGRKAGPVSIYIANSIQEMEKWSLKTLLDGSWIETSQWFDVYNKYNGKVVDRVPLCNEKHVERALDSAYAASKKMKEVPAYERADILEKTSTALQKSSEDLARTISAEAGKPLKYSRREAKRACVTMKFASEEAKRITGETIAFDAEPRGVQHHGYWFRVPVGLVAAITPFNDPLNLVAHKLGPAFAAGNAVVLKPASLTPLSALNLSHALVDSGLPAGALNVVTGPGDQIGRKLCSDPRVRLVTLTGGTEAGRDVINWAGIKRFAMELGSNCPVIVMNDAPMILTVENCVDASCNCQGQNCIHAQRFYVQEGVYREFVNQMTSTMERLIVGDPLDDKTDVGPMISEREAIRVEEWVNDAVKKGAKLLVGGKREGAMFFPTLLENAPHNASIASEEIFGPVSVLYKFSKLSEAIEASNGTNYGLQAGIFTSNVNTALQAVKDLDFGGVLINDTSDFRVDFMPFGGMKLSGLGREGIRFAIEEMTEIKTVIYKTSGEEL
jgi:glyceraldehyde-3-phosphate dehydrogenase (NADP+)